MKNSQIEAVERALLDAVTKALPELVGSAVERAVARVPVIRGRDGRDASDGEDGRDGDTGFVDVVESWEPRRYKARELATHRGGTWQAIRATSAEPMAESPEWMPIARGIDGVAAERLERDGALSLRLRLDYSDGIAEELDVEIPTAVHLGKWDEVSETIRRGDEVAWQGCSWRANKDEPDGSPPGADWTLTAKAGDRGKAGRAASAIATAKLSDAGALVLVLADGTELAPVPMPVGREGPAGEQGEPGPPGDTGPMGGAWQWRGVYEQGKTYPENSVVKWAQRVWLSTRETKDEPSAVSPAWEILVESSGVGGGGGASAAIPPTLNHGPGVATWANLPTAGAFTTELRPVAEFGGLPDGRTGEGGAMWDGTKWLPIGGKIVGDATRHLVITVTQATTDGVFDVTTPRPYYTLVGDTDGSLGASAAAFANDENVDILNEVGGSVKPEMVWLSTAEFRYPGHLDVGDTVQVRLP